MLYNKIYNKPQIHTIYLNKAICNVLQCLFFSTGVPFFVRFWSISNLLSLPLRHVRTLRLSLRANPSACLTQPAAYQSANTKNHTPTYLQPWSHCWFGWWMATWYAHRTYGACTLNTPTAPPAGTVWCA
jgi:hypothetical protein